MNGCEQHTKYHIYDVLGHTAVAVGATDPNLLTRWAALCHDMGKPAAAFFDEDGVEHFYGHAKISCVIARPLLQRMCKSDKFTNDVLTLIKYHDDVIEPTEKSVKRALKRLDGRTDLFDALCDLKQADASAQAPMCADRINLAHELLTIKNKIVEGDGVFSLKNLVINGHDVINSGIAAGPAVGVALNCALDAVIDGVAENNRQSLLEFIQNLPLEFHN
jgi:tRNA nucleotidyltransferase (CCA-adding enzyme)